MVVFVEKVQDLMGSNAAKIAEKLIKHPQLTCYFVKEPATRSDVRRALDTLGDYTEGVGDDSVVAPALRVVFGALGARVPLDTLNPANVPSRPSEQGLELALDKMAETKEAFADTKMSLVHLKPPVLRQQAGTIRLCRGIFRVVSRFTMSLVRNLAVVEDAAATALRQQYEPIRKAALIEDDLSEGLEAVETYLYGAAKQAADTNKAQKARMADMTQEAQKRGTLAAQQQARTDIAEEVSALADALRSATPAPAPPPQTTDARTTTR